MILLAKGKNNLNKTLNKNNDINFIQACNLLDEDFSQNELFLMLKSGNIFEKHFAALNINNISDNNEAEILVSNLTGCDGKIREAVSLKINELIYINKNCVNFFTKYPEIFSAATIDINANICRMVLNSVKFLITDNEFKTKYYDKIFSYIEECFNELDKFIYKDKKYVINKQLFKLYWCLEAILLCPDAFDNVKLSEILTRAATENEYTIREKVAQIVVKLDNCIFDRLKNALSDDANYYVKSVFG